MKKTYGVFSILEDSDDIPHARYKRHASCTVCGPRGGVAPAQRTEQKRWLFLFLRQASVVIRHMMIRNVGAVPGIL